MNILEELKIKPNVEKHSMVNVKLNFELIDERNKGYDFDELNDKINKHKISKVKDVSKTSKHKKINVDKTTGIKEDEDEDQEEKKARKTKKPVHGVAVLGPEVRLIIDNKPISSLMPKSQPKMIIKVPSYYMNNREIFINSINSIFGHYKKELGSGENISCDNIGKGSGTFSLLTHQKITRDYLNIYTPYRGLLLYHGLGSGKTCTSIAIAEGMKDNKKIIIMTPASLRSNYMVELKKCGDLLFRRNQFWKWISTSKNPKMIEILSSVLNIPTDYIKRRKGAWFVNVNEPSNYASLTGEEKSSLDEQLDKMIESKYTFINYNGLRTKSLSDLTDGFTKNIFDGAVVIIDEAHNLISRIVNKIKAEKEVKENKRGEKDHLPKFLAVKLYEYLMSAIDARVILLTGTPVINYPNEFSILFNILRGYIKTWHIPLNVKTSAKIDKERLIQMFSSEKTLDYLDYSASSKMLTITRNPFGFKNTYKSDKYRGVTHEKRDEVGEYSLDESFKTDDAFEKKIVGILSSNDIGILPEGINIKYFKALPDNFDSFNELYINDTTKELKNVDSLKRRILGLSSYFRSAQEDLLPRFTKSILEDYHILNIPMSDYQFKIYESARKEERKTEKPKKQGVKSIYEDSSSTYRIFSRLFCNFVMPDRPMPRIRKTDVKEGEENNSSSFANIGEILKEAKKMNDAIDVNVKNEGEVEADELLNIKGDENYKERIEKAIENIVENSGDFLTPEKLEIYSPKYLHMLENIKDNAHKGLHLVYSQFRTLEGIGMFSLVLEKNGFTRFKIKKTGSDSWDLDIHEDKIGTPMYALYTGTETSEEKEIIRNIYNSSWDDIPTNISEKLKAITKNNNFGEVVKVLMITSSGSEGINLRNTRYVHIMEPYWHPVRTEQVIGRARRICSHKDLPLEYQTVEVFIYLMVFSEKQLKSDDAIELKRKDLGKKLPPQPVTSDQLLFEISSIKENISNQLTKIIKESSFDCSIYPHGKENIMCMNFTNPSTDEFSYGPDYLKQQSDVSVAVNKKKTVWVGKIIEIADVKYIYKRLSETIIELYDLESYKRAIENPDVVPVKIGTLEIDKTKSNKPIFKKI